MIKSINVKSLLQAKESLSEEAFFNFLKFYGIEVRDAEIHDLKCLVESLVKENCSIEGLGRFFLGYKIPQIAKEFDLLRFNSSSILNIELKRSCSEDKIKNQLIRNKYYLSFLNKQIYSFTYVSESNKVYFLEDGGGLVELEIKDLVGRLNVEVGIDYINPDILFDPSNYLVSPFNSTERFLNGEYFLTNQQEDIKRQVIELIGNSDAATFFSIVGSAGTGKTLLTYDIAKNVKKNTLIIHCGQLNFGHLSLMEKGWKIVAIKDFESCKAEKYDLLIIDESQRIYEKQLNSIIEKVNREKICCIFSHDKSQVLASWEEKRNASATISSIVNIAEYKLSEKIRTNKEIGGFIKSLFSKKKNEAVVGNGNIEVNFFSNYICAKKFLDSLDPKRWEVLRFTPSQYKREHHESYFGKTERTSHQVIGQEFDGVAVIMDPYFSYDENGNLTYKGKAYYDPAKMLFQNITRARKRLNVIIVGNEEILSRCISLLH